MTRGAIDKRCIGGIESLTTQQHRGGACGRMPSRHELARDLHHRLIAPGYQGGQGVGKASLDDAHGFIRQCLWPTRLMHKGGQRGS